MSAFNEISGNQIRKIDIAMNDLSRLRDFDAVEGGFVEMAKDLLPADCICWNNWSLKMDTPLVCRTSPDYMVVLNDLNGVLNELVKHHPILVGGGHPLVSIRPQRMSDFQSHAAFKHNPLYREVYRHLDTRSQLSYTASVHATGIVNLSWNRRQQDFSERDRGVLHVIGRRLDVVLKRIDERRRLERMCRALQPAMEIAAGPGAAVTLSPQEGRLLAGLIRGAPRAEVAARLGWRRDTLDRRLAQVRDRLGFENTGQMLAELARLRALKSAATIISQGCHPS
ncbi:MAG TPA: hypothetical protein VIO38_02565 [Rariglobus sp.]